MMMMMTMMMMSGIGEAELHLARSDIANFFHAHALSHCQLAISSFTRYGVCNIYSACLSLEYTSL